MKIEEIEELSVKLNKAYNLLNRIESIENIVKELKGGCYDINISSIPQGMNFHLNSASEGFKLILICAFEKEIRIIENQIKEL